VKARDWLGYLGINEMFNFEMGLEEIRCEDADWIHLAQEAGSCEHGSMTGME
jgi:hypothetical protein